MCLQLLSPKEADKRLRTLGGDDAIQSHCLEGTFDKGAPERLQVLVT